MRAASEPPRGRRPLTRAAMRLGAARLLLTTTLVAGIAFDGAEAQVRQPVNPPPAPVQTTTPVAPAVAPTVAPTTVAPTTLTPAATIAPPTIGNLGGSRSSLGVGLGVAGAALAVGFVGAMSRPSTFSGENSRQLETGPPPAQDDIPAPRHVRHARIRTLQNAQVQAPAPRVVRPGFTVPTKTERRYVPDEVLLVIKGETSPQRVKRLEAAYGLTPLASARIDLLKVDVRRYRLKPGTSVPTILVALRGSAVVTSAQPNYRFELQDEPTAPATKAKLSPTDDKIAPSPIPTSGPVQYAVEILHLTEAHRRAMGADVRVAVIDSGLDETNPDIQGAVIERFDAVGAPFKPHSHGTAIAGAIVAHHTLIGIAPKAKLIAIRAFAGAASVSNGTGFDILRGLDFAASHGARIVNMSFAGPQDPLLEAALLAAQKEGIVAIAAAGNGGPQAKPLYPGAEPGIIAVTATDAEGRPFARANRGAYIAVAAPGVNILAPGLGDSVQLTSGTSIATAEASGVVALMLERDPKATPAQIRKILSATAKRLAVEPAAGGAGIIDADAALAAAE